CLKAGSIVHHRPCHSPPDCKGTGSHRLRFERLHMGTFVYLRRYYATKIFLQIHFYRPRAESRNILGAGQFHPHPHSTSSRSSPASVRSWSCASTSFNFSGIGRPICPAFSRRLTPSLEI